MDNVDQYLFAITTQLTAAQQTNQRRLVTLAGDQLWASQLLNTYISQQTFQNPIWIGSNAPAGCLSMDRQEARQLLGSELDLLIYNAWSGLDPDALAAANGALRGGGLMVMVVPPLEAWPKYEDPDYQRLLVHPFSTDHFRYRFNTFFRDSLKAADKHLLLEQGQPISTSSIPINNDLKPELRKPGWVSSDQSLAIAAVKKTMTGHSRRPLVITADRGRGKSATLGLACGELMQAAARSIVITAPRLSSVSIVFEHAARQLGLVVDSRAKLSFGDSSLLFLAPDVLLAKSPEANLVVVDEAAALPEAMLAKILERYNRVVFSTTTYGYEGTGRGFEVRFKKYLDKHTPQWRNLQLHEPIRWAANDPVERWLFDALLLDSHAAKLLEKHPAALDLCVTEQLDRDILLSDKQSLSQLFGLLVVAHYQTSPSDLRNLLDGPNITLWVTRFQGNIIAAALVAEEGRIEPDLSREIWQGRRRPRGHLIPQTLSVHAGFQQAPALSYQRVMRIAVHPELQRQGFGRQLLLNIISHFRQQECDFVGSSFAATSEVLAFWRSLQCVPVRLGVSRDASSGCYSAVVLCSLSEPAAKFLDTARRRFNQQFPASLCRQYAMLEADVVAQLLRDTMPETFQPLDQQDWLDIEAFSKAYRQYDVCLLPLSKLLCWGFSKGWENDRLTQQQQQLLIGRMLQNRPLSMVVEYSGLTDKKQIQQAIRDAIKTLWQKAKSYQSASQE